MDRELSADEFRRYRDLIYRSAGIHYADEKLELLSNRVQKRVRATGAGTYGAYLARLHDPRHAGELQALLDVVTTHETYFFRCPRHWQWLRETLAQRAADPVLARQRLRIWSAAASTGAEPYTVAIVLRELAARAAVRPPAADVLGTDLSAQVLAEAKRAVYRGYAVAQTPPDVVARCFTRKGDDQLALDPAIVRSVQLRQHNLMDPVPDAFGTFDVVFLRNVMIYFDDASRERTLRHVLAALRPGGHLVLGESESLLGVTHGFHHVKPSIFQRPLDAVPAAPAPTKR